MQRPPARSTTGMPLLLITLLLAFIGLTRAAGAQAQDYLVYVASEATDEVSLVRWGPAGASVERKMTVGVTPVDPDGPHGVAMSPDGRYLYVSTAHGLPFGYLWKFDAASGRELGRVTLGNFPATVQITPDGAYAYVVNFNLHGDPIPSSVSVVATDQMVEVARIPTCTMPHGSRINPQGTRQYSACMMDDLLVEIDTGTLGVARHFVLAKGQEAGMEGPPDLQERHRSAGHGVSCSPTWAQPSADGSKVYAACNKSNDIVEIDVRSWTMDRRIPAGDGVYNLAVTGDGRLLIATNKRGRSVSVFDLRSGQELARIATLRPVVHGVAISPDNRYAFVSVEGIGSEPGTVEIVDLVRRVRVSSVDVGQMAGGIAFWKTIPPTISNP